MKKRLVVFMTLVAACFTITASAQSKLRMELNYNISSPVGSFKNDFIGKTSFNGVTGEISYPVSPKWAVGLHSGYQSYYQKYDRATYKLDENQTVSAVLTNQMNITPVLLRGTFYPLGGSATAKVHPYVSAGAGVNLVTYGQYLGEFGGTETSSPFAAQAGAGVQVPFGNSLNQTGIKLGATYNYVNYNRNDIQKLNNIGFNAGVVFGLK